MRFSMALFCRVVFKASGNQSKPPSLVPDFLFFPVAVWLRWCLLLGFGPNKLCLGFWYPYVPFMPHIRCCLSSWTGCLLGKQFRWQTSVDLFAQIHSGSETRYPEKQKNKRKKTGGGGGEKQPPGQVFVQSHEPHPR